MILSRIRMWYNILLLPPIQTGRIYLTPVGPLNTGSPIPFTSTAHEYPSLTTRGQQVDTCDPASPSPKGRSQNFAHWALSPPAGMREYNRLTFPSALTCSLESEPRALTPSAPLSVLDTRGGSQLYQVLTRRTRRAQEADPVPDRTRCLRSVPRV